MVYPPYLLQMDLVFAFPVVRWLFCSFSIAAKNRCFCDKITNGDEIAEKKHV
jgi:hypothetical protein